MSYHVICNLSQMSEKERERETEKPTVVVAAPSSLAYLIALVTLGAAFGNMFLAGKIRSVMRAEMPRARQAASGTANVSERVRAEATTQYAQRARAKAEHDARQRVARERVRDGERERADFAFFDPRLAHCDTLGLAHSLRGDEKAIKSRFREVVMHCHPDLVADEREKSERSRRFQEVNAAQHALLEYIHKSRGAKESS